MKNEANTPSSSSSPDWLTPTPAASARSSAESKPSHVSSHSSVSELQERGSESHESPTFDRHAAAERLLNQAERVVKEIRALGHVASSTANEALVGAKVKGLDVVETGKERTLEARHDLERYVEREPLKSVLIAAGVGLLFGMWSRR